MTNTNEEIYKNKFLPLYNAGNFEEAEEIARKNNLATMLNDAQFARMLLIGGNKSHDSATSFLDRIYAGNVDGALDSFHENESVNNYWIKSMESRN